MMAGTGPQRRPLEPKKENLMHLPYKNTDKLVSPSSFHPFLVSSHSPSLGGSIGRKLNYDCSAVMGLPPARPAPPPQFTRVSLGQKEWKMKDVADINSGIDHDGTSCEAVCASPSEETGSFDNSDQDASLLSELPELDFCDVSPFRRSESLQQIVEYRPKTSPIVVSSQPLARASTTNSYSGVMDLESQEQLREEDEPANTFAGEQAKDSDEKRAEVREMETAPAQNLGAGPEPRSGVQTLEEKLRNLDQAFQTPFAAGKNRLQTQSDEAEMEIEHGEEPDPMGNTRHDFSGFERIRRAQARDSCFKAINTCCEDIAKINSSVKELRLEIQGIRTMCTDLLEREKKNNDHVNLRLAYAKPCSHDSVLAPLGATCQSFLEAVTSIPRIACCSKSQRFYIRSLSDVDPKVLYLVKCRAYMRWRKKAMSELEDKQMRGTQVIEV